jgi:muconolactone delta-isomerase
VLYLVHLRFSDPPGASQSELDALRKRETTRAHELQQGGTLIGLWREPGQRASWAMWDVAPPTNWTTRYAPSPTGRGCRCSSIRCRRIPTRCIRLPARSPTGDGSAVPPGRILL